ncbi:hypothetical protein HanXRQr2_Chr03g0118881 [Helianthus annuus]|uniref:Reverse transcriptase domain-containing protein n=2 Tax=Helianthus annuus TaxID=4232 RepID=A0A9K3JH37_HELAN|nr:hypothetical protein HanXRQr2_Chr03g0118881 [Helianthus annuus]KAJ0944337.1 hypothetical protein HanPSC8_Chr03g0115481 [Helianthus annuus]
MVRQVTQEEVKAVMFSIGENKAPGPDGYTSAFFKRSWDIVGDEVTAAVLQFFENGVPAWTWSWRHSWSIFHVYSARA